MQTLKSKESLTESTKARKKFIEEGINSCDAFIHLAELYQNAIKEKKKLEKNKPNEEVLIENIIKDQVKRDLKIKSQENTKIIETVTPKIAPLEKEIIFESRDINALLPLRSFFRFEAFLRSAARTDGYELSPKITYLTRSETYHQFLRDLNIDNENGEFDGEDDQTEDDKYITKKSKNTQQLQPQQPQQPQQSQQSQQPQQSQQSQQPQQSQEPPSFCTSPEKLAEFVVENDCDHLFLNSVILGVCNSDISLRRFLKKLDELHETKIEGVDRFMKYWIRIMRISFAGKMPRDYFYPIISEKSNEWIKNRYGELIEKMADRPIYPSPTKIVLDDEDDEFYRNIVNNIKPTEKFQKLEDSNEWIYLLKYFKDIPNPFDFGPNIQYCSDEKSNDNDPEKNTNSYSNRCKFEDIVDAYNYIFLVLMNIFSIDTYNRNIISSEYLFQPEIFLLTIAYTNSISNCFMQHFRAPENNDHKRMVIHENFLKYREALMETGNWFGAAQFIGKKDAALDNLDNKIIQETKKKWESEVAKELETTNDCDKRENLKAILERIKNDNEIFVVSTSKDLGYLDHYSTPDLREKMKGECISKVLIPTIIKGAESGKYKYLFLPELIIYVHKQINGCFENYKQIKENENIKKGEVKLDFFYECCKLLEVIFGLQRSVGPKQVKHSALMIAIKSMIQF